MDRFKGGIPQFSNEFHHRHQRDHQMWQWQQPSHRLLLIPIHQDNDTIAKKPIFSGHENIGNLGLRVKVRMKSRQ
jgi:hypothetical protein